jgi:hypothetical protein
VFDNADDIDMWMYKPTSKQGSGRRLLDYLPQSTQGSIVFTTRDWKTAFKLAPQNVVEDSLWDAICVQHGSDFFPADFRFPPPKSCAQDLAENGNSEALPKVEQTVVDMALQNFIIRRERQSFRKLKLSGALLLIVHTSMTFINELPEEELLSLLDEGTAWPDDIAAYRERLGWMARARGESQKTWKEMAVKLN